MSVTSDDAPFSALAFKIATDPYVGRLCFFGSIPASGHRHHRAQLHQEAA